MVSVQGKVNAIKQKCTEVHAGAGRIVTGIREQERVNSAAVNEIHAGAGRVEAACKALVTNVKSYIRNFYFGK